MSIVFPSHAVGLLYAQPYLCFTYLNLTGPFSACFLILLAISLLLKLSNNAAPPIKAPGAVNLAPTIVPKIYSAICCFVPFSNLYCYSQTTFEFLDHHFANVNNHKAFPSSSSPL